MRSTIFSKEKIVLHMRSSENFPFRGKFSEVYLHLNAATTDMNWLSMFFYTIFLRIDTIYQRDRFNKRIK